MNRPMAGESEYQRAWRERGEAEAALRKWRHNQSSPTFVKMVSMLGGLASCGIIAGFIQDPSWTLAPVLILAALFGSMPFLAPVTLRDEARARAEAEATFRKLGIRTPSHD